MLCRSQRATAAEYEGGYTAVQNFSHGSGGENKARLRICNETRPRLDNTEQLAMAVHLLYQASARAVQPTHGYLRPASADHCQAHEMCIFSVHLTARKRQCKSP